MSLVACAPVKSDASPSAKIANDVVAQLAQLRKAINAQVDPHEQLEKVVVSKDEWTIENGMLTPTLKLKRAAIESRYGEHLEGWYREGEAVFFA